jgi:hypothetical protein
MTMTKLAEILSPEQREVLAALKAHAVVNAKAEHRPQPEPLTHAALEACACSNKQGHSVLPGR